MTTLNISLPAGLKKVVDQQVEEGRFASHSDYVRSLIRDDQKRAQQKALEAKLVQRLREKSIPMTGKDFDNIRTRLDKAVSGRRKATR
jgi:antitoxin ParD1/3/4